MKKFSKKVKSYIINALIFILGVIVTIIFNKIFDKIIPSNPIIVKELSDTIKIVHEYRIPEKLNDDSTRFELEKKIKNLEMLNNYDEQIKERIKLMEKDNIEIPNLILTNKSERLRSKGYIYGSSSPYFSSDCPNLNKDFLEIRINFFNPELVKNIAFLRVDIYRFENNNSSEARLLILEEYYEVKPSNNFIKISNDLLKGKYEIVYGFILKEDLTKDYPTFYFKKCIVQKEN